MCPLALILFASIHLVIITRHSVNFVFSFTWVIYTLIKIIQNWSMHQRHIKFSCKFFVLCIIVSLSNVRNNIPIIFNIIYDFLFCENCLRNCLPKLFHCCHLYNVMVKAGSKTWLQLNIFNKKKILKIEKLKIFIKILVSLTKFPDDSWELVGCWIRKF